MHLHRSSHTLGRKQERGSGGWDARLSNSCVAVKHTQPAPVCMEEVRDMGLCKVLDSLKDTANFKKKGNKIILISHQWLGFKTPDTADAV